MPVVRATSLATESMEFLVALQLLVRNIVLEANLKA